MDGESALRSAEFSLSRARTPPPVPWPDARPQSLRSPGLLRRIASLRRSRVLHYRAALIHRPCGKMSKRITPFASRYCSTLDRLKEAIRRKRPGLLRRGVVLHSASIPRNYF
ncbi:histone-lysine N-methyltransferase SETMAR [Plakobranchus ocellatus]|uniref:Histone-lysine N-methyltransferase SETMAR n=1 Tax=Plakobranchus ocellatus TaxID=259542 RepID=A0AAV3YTT2_9GAST|nr:histone-lysine N-methyltransferase SETMAR [Plakobranchus ocellatus]